MFPNLNANPPLFGAGAGTGLFGAQNKPPAGAPTGGLFGAQLPAQQGAGLFAQPQGGQQPSAMNNNLFGGPLGAQATAQQPGQQPTGLFAAGGQAVGGGLFNAPKPGPVGVQIGGQATGFSLL